MPVYKNQLTVLFISLALMGSCMSGHVNLRRSRRQLDSLDTSSDLDAHYGAQNNAADYDFLGQLSARPKRQWCRRGMTYNYVLGYCVLSYAAMRNRGKFN